MESEVLSTPIEDRNTSLFCIEETLKKKLGDL